MDHVKLCWRRGTYYLDFLSIISVKDVYKSELGYKNVEHIYVLELGMNMNECLFFCYTNILDLFANHEIDAPIFEEDILTISYEIDPPID